MRGNELLDKMELVSPGYLEAADAKAITSKHSRAKWGVMAACLCLVAGSFAAIHSISLNRPTNEEGSRTLTDVIAYGFTLDAYDGIVYFPISFEDRVRYGLVEEGAVGLTPENTYQILPDDIGAFMGTVAVCGDEALVGRSVYHFAKYPNSDSICILETEDGYIFYTAQLHESIG